MTNDWFRSVEMRFLVEVVFFDFSASYSALLLENLSCYGFEQSTLTWFHSSLTNRTQKGYFNGSFSDNQTVQCGVPQGSCLGPLSLIFTNDLPYILERAKIVMYADDLTIYTSARTNNELETVMNIELVGVVKWVTANKLVLNVLKTNGMLMGWTYKVNSNPALNVNIDNAPINNVHETKLMGVTV